jgi:hypothetical protein
VPLPTAVLGAASKKRPWGITGEKQHGASQHACWRDAANQREHFHPISFSLPKMEDKQMKTSNSMRPWLARIERNALIASKRCRVSKSGPPYQEQPPTVRSANMSRLGRHGTSAPTRGDAEAQALLFGLLLNADRVMGRRAVVEVSKGSRSIWRGRLRLDNPIPSRLCFYSGKTRHEVFSQKKSRPARGSAGGVLCK